MADEEIHPNATDVSGGVSSPSFVGLVLTQFLGSFNDNLFRWLAALIAAQVVGQATAIAVGTLCLTVPFLIFSPAAGWLADRYSKRTVIIACKFAEIVFMVFGVLAILYGNVTLLCSVIFLIGVQSALFGPAKFGSISEMLPFRDLSKGNGIMGMVTIVSVGLGTVAGFILFDMTKPGMGVGDWERVWPLAVVLIGLAVLGTLTSLMIRTGPAADPTRRPALNPVMDAWAALKLLGADVRLLRSAWGIAYFYFLASLAQQNIDPFGEHVLQLGKTETGVLLGVLIAGVGIGSLVAGYWSHGNVELGIVPLGSLGIVLSSVMVFVFGLSMSWFGPSWSSAATIGSAVGLFFLGASAGLFVIPLEAYLQFRSERKTRGAVLAGAYVLTYALIVLSAGIFYLMTTVLQLNPSLTFLLASLMTIPVTLYITAVIPDLAFRFLLWLWTWATYRFRIYGRENIPDQGGALIVANHASFADGILMCVSHWRRIRFIIYTDFTEMPLLRTLGKIMRVIPIKASDGPKALVASLRTARQAILDGELVCIFAEGGLTRTGQMQPFQRGMMKIVQGTGAPIIPAYLNGLWGSILSWRAGPLFWKKPRKWPYPVQILFGKPLLNPVDAAHVRQEVERLGAEAAIMDTIRRPIPARLFIRRCKSAKRREKISDSTNVSLSGGKLLTAALAMRSALKRHVLTSSERNVGLLLPPSVGGCLANMALALDRRVAVNLNYTLSEDVLNYCVKKAGLKHVLTSRKFLEKKPYQLEGAEFVFLEDIKEKITGLDKMRALVAAFCVPASLLESSLQLNKVSPDDTLTIVFTSGSTGEPKGVVLSHANVGSNIEAIDKLVHFKDSDALLGVLPLFHSFGYTGSMWLPMCYNIRGIYHFNPLDAKVVGRLCRDNKATIFMATPTFLKMYLKRCEKEEFESLELLIVGAEKLPVDLAKCFQEKFGVLPIEGYGTTELSPVAAVNVPDHRSAEVTQLGTKLGTVGRPLPGVTAKVVDPDSGQDLGIGREGLLMIKGPNVMCGYLDEAEKTNAILKLGWYNTGDFALIDEDGFIAITGRQSRFSKIGGEMVPHIRIEQELLTICEPPDDIEGELTLAVTAVPDDSRGERLIVLYTKLCKPVDQVIKELAATGIPKLWLPSSDSFVQVDQIPVLGTGKLDLRGIKDLALQLCASEPQASGAR